MNEPEAPSEQLITEAHEIKIFSLAKLGEVLDRAIDHGGGRPRKNGPAKEPFSGKTTLADIGISKKESSAAQNLSRMAREKPDAFKAVLRREKTPQEVHREERKRKAHAEVKAAELEKSEPPKGVVFGGSGDWPPSGGRGWRPVSFAPAIVSFRGRPIKAGTGGRRQKARQAVRGQPAGLDKHVTP